VPTRAAAPWRWFGKRALSVGRAPDPTERSCGRGPPASSAHVSASGSFDTQTVGSSCPDESDVAESGVGPRIKQLIGAHTGSDALLCAACHAELAAKGGSAPELNDLLQPWPSDWQDIGETTSAETSPAAEAGCLDMSNEFSALFDEGEATWPTSPVVLGVAAAAPQPEAGSEESPHKAAGAAADSRQRGFQAPPAAGDPACVCIGRHRWSPKV
jgi:hypothetical protein